MKIGILTFHSQLNYGGVLQCLALQTELEKLGHTVIVIDRWINDDNSLLECGFDKYGLQSWLRFFLRSLLGLGDINQYIRVRRTKKFINEHLRLSDFHFVEWKDAPNELGIDLLVVGSDQVWHCDESSDPSVYLLKYAPCVQAISYAASFGLTELPKAFNEIYKQGLSKFKAISCREKEGVAICRSLGFEAIHVVDPTLLAWGRDALSCTQKVKRRELFCYFLSESIDEYIEALEMFARKNKCIVRIMVGGAYLLPFPSNLINSKKYIKGLYTRLNSKLKIIDNAGPKEFLEAFERAQWVVSDSFHALMFSICNGCDVRIIRPSSAYRQKMFARIAEFASHTQGDLIVDTVSNALDSFSIGEKVEFDYDWIKIRCQESENWLKRNLV